MIALARKPVVFGLALLLAMMTVAPVAAQNGIAAEDAFYNNWARTDKPVLDGMVDRTWMWGPQANTEVITEPYADSPGGMREVQYYDKARMEVNNPDAVYDGLWYVTNGLLVVELMTGMMQMGHDDFEEHDPAMVNIAGDPGFAETPTYATYGTLMDDAAWDDGATITATVAADGTVGSDETLAAFGVTAGVMAPETGHRTASVFWEFMTSEGLVWDWETGETMTARLFENAYYATGLPITEAYWAHIMVDGTAKWVLTQAFERRVLTYTPDNDAGWQVEAGNVGLHYREWRQANSEPPGPDPVELTDQVLYTELSGDNEVPPVETTATGSAFVWVTEDGALHFQVMVADIVDVTASHIHLAPVGVNGPVVVPLFSGEFSGDGVLAEGTITADMLANDLEGMSLEILMAHMVAGNTYVNVHTIANPGGEIRGQLMLSEMEPPPIPVETETFHVMFGALNESGVSGSATLSLEGDQLTVMIEASGLEADALHPHHIHGVDVEYSVCPTPGMAGEDGVLSFADGLPAYGGVQVDLTPHSTADADGNISFNETFTLENTNLDLAAHTIILHGMTVGEEYDASLPVACGVIMPEGSFMSELSGGNVLPDPIVSDGSGFATYHMTSDGTGIVYTLVVNGLTDVTAAHIHLENEGEDTGGVVVPLFGTEVEEGVASNGVLASGVITADDLVNALEGMTLEDLMAEMVAGETYTNVHTVTYGAGEIRGQIVMHES